MTQLELSMIAFAVLNIGRILAYFPQFLQVYRDPHGAAAVSVLTWALFTAANVATVLYVLVATGDRIVATVFALNAAGCLAIAVMTMIKRWSCARRPVSG
jgi:hypothetical protein